MVPWSDLPADLLQSIANMLLGKLIDYIRLRAVCVSWRSSTVDPHNLKHPLPDQLPWALYLFDKRRDIGPFLRLSDRKTVHISAPEVRGDRIVGSTDGWLIMVDLSIPALRLGLGLVNPLTRAQIRLPPVALMVEGNDEMVTIECCGGSITTTLSLRHICDSMIQKVVFSEDHTVVMAIFSNRIAYVSPGDEQWTMINPPSSNAGKTFVWSDILHHKGSIYVVDRRGRLAIWNLVHPASLTPVASVDKLFHRWFLASSGEELFLIAKVFNFKHQPIRKFQVFRLDSSSSKSILLEEVKSLGDRILFLGRNRSLCLSAGDCPGYKPNSIYITGSYFGNDEDRHDPCDFGFYNLEDGCFYPKLPEEQLKPSIWFTPSLC